MQRVGFIHKFIDLQETCRDAHGQSGTNKLIWECCISYSTSIGVVFGSLKTTPIDVEYEIQHSHICLLVLDHLCASRQVSCK